MSIKVKDNPGYVEPLYIDIDDITPIILSRVSQVEDSHKVSVFEGLVAMQEGHNNMSHGDVDAATESYQYAREQLSSTNVAYEINFHYGCALVTNEISAEGANSLFRFINYESDTPFMQRTEPHSAAYESLACAFRDLGDNCSYHDAKKAARDALAEENLLVNSVDLNARFNKVLSISVLDDEVRARPGDITPLIARSRQHAHYGNALLALGDCTSALEIYEKSQGSKDNSKMPFSIMETYLRRISAIDGASGDYRYGLNERSQSDIKKVLSVKATQINASLISKAYSIMRDSYNLPTSMKDVFLVHDYGGSQFQVNARFISEHESRRGVFSEGVVRD